MLRTEIEAVLAEALVERRMLAHPFYRRWVAGDLSRAELASYAEQYRHFEAALPEILEDATARIADPTARQLVQANLDDERAVPAPHLELFDAFAAAVGADTAAPATPATVTLVEQYRAWAAASTAPPTVALAAVATYEIQAPEIAASKAEGLSASYGLDADGTRFWEVHAGVDELHGEWIVDALAAVADDLHEVRRAADAAASAWWAFLDERELAGVTPGS